MAMRGRLIVPKKTRKKRNKNHYFTSVHEEAIIKYVASSSNVEKTKLYENFIGPAFNELVDKITFTYKFTTLPNIDYLREECKFWLVTILDKYDPNKGSKAFSYFSVVTKNWFIHKVKKTSKQARREISFEDIKNAAQSPFLTTEHEYEKKRERKEFWDLLLEQLKNWHSIQDGKNLTSNDIKVLKAIQELLKEPEEVEILNKKAIYLYLREITGLNTKQVANSLKRFKVRYYEFKQNWESGKI